jgi:hypothetical protein
LFWSAFWELSTERQIGMGMGPIPWSKIRSYFAEDGFCGGDLEWATALIRKMDNAYTGMLSGSKNDEPEMADSAKATDTEGVKRVMRGLGKRFEQSRKPKMK